MRCNTLRAQATIVVHEIAHEVQLTGFEHDFNNPKAGLRNDQQVDANCRQLIEGLQ